MTMLLDRARMLAFALPAALLAGAWGSQLIGHLYPCEMCHWQRWPHYAALVLALLAFAVRRQPGALSRLLTILAGIAILASGAIGVYHAGVEYGWWQGFTQCTQTLAGGSGEDMLTRIMATPLIRCDVAQWTLFGVSLAGFNALISLPGGALVLFGATRR